LKSNWIPAYAGMTKLREIYKNFAIKFSYLNQLSESVV